ncbi:MAG: hypothetical protein ACFCBU_02280 [Cyanophyceae cyanobacterium]
MSQSNPVRRSAQDDFLSSLEQLGDTFGVLEDDSLSASAHGGDPSMPESNGDALEAIADDISSSDSFGDGSESRAIAEGYDGRNDTVSEKPGRQQTNPNQTKD